MGLQFWSIACVSFLTDIYESLFGVKIVHKGIGGGMMFRFAHG